MKNTLIKIIRFALIFVIIAFGLYYFLETSWERSQREDFSNITDVKPATESELVDTLGYQVEKKDVEKQEVIVATNGMYEYAQTSDDKWLLVRDSYIFEGERSPGNLVIFDKVNNIVKAQIPNIISFTIGHVSVGEVQKNAALQETLDDFRNHDINNILISEFYNFEPSGFENVKLVPNKQKIEELEEELGIQLDDEVHGFGEKPILGVGVLYILNLNTLEKTHIGLGGYDGLINVEAYIPTAPVIITERDMSFGNLDIKKGNGLQYKLVY